MKQNYYEILEVDKNASPEIIKKAYSTLVKKYHPDLQNDNVKHLYEEKLKLINEAYDVLSNEKQRKSYNQTIVDDYAVLEEKVAKLSKENAILRSQYQSLKENIYPVNNYQTSYQTPSNAYSQINYTEEQSNNAEQKYSYTSTVQDSNNRKYKKQQKNSYKNFLALFLTFVILLLLYKIPFIQDFILNNPVLHAIFNIF